MPTSAKVRTDDTPPPSSICVGQIQDAQPHAHTWTLSQSVRLFPKTIAYCIACCSSVLLFGYDLVIVSTVNALDPFVRDFGDLHEGDYIVPARWFAMWEAIPTIFAVVGNAFGGWAQDRIGRRWTLAIGSVLSAVAITMLYVCDRPDTIAGRREFFLWAKVVQGFAVGLIVTTAQTYISEISPTSLRGPMLALIPMTTLIGQLTGSLVVFSVSGDETSHGYKTAFASCYPFSAVPLVLSFLLPESPSWLVRRDSMDAALAASKRLLTSKVNAEEYLKDIQMTIQVEQATATDITYAECFKGINARRTGIVILGGVLPALFGLPLLSSASYFLQLLGMGTMLSLIMLIVGIVAGLISNLSGIWLLTKFGRRSLTLASLTTTVLLYATMGIAGFFNTPAVKWVVSVTLLTTTAVLGLGAWPAGPAITSETSSLRLRARTVGIGTLSGNVATVVMNTVLPYMYNPDAGDLRAKVGLVMAGVVVIVTAIVWLVLPELKDRSMVEIHAMFELKLPARDFKNWRSDGDMAVHQRLGLSEHEVERNVVECKC